MRILFDTYEINNNYIINLAKKETLFSNNTFRMGSTTCVTIDLSVDKRAFKSSAAALPEKVIIEGQTYYIDNYDFTNGSYYQYELVDPMVKLNAPLKWEAETSPTVKELYNQICTKFNLKPQTASFYLEDIKLTWDNQGSVTCRDLISYIAEVNCSFARIIDNTLEFVSYVNSKPIEVDIITCADYKAGDAHTIKRVVLEMGSKTVKYPIEEQGTPLYLNNENILFTDSQNITKEAIVEHIYNEIKDFTFCNFSTSRCAVATERAWPNLVFKGAGLSFKTIGEIDLSFNSIWTGGYKMTVDTPAQEETTVRGNNIDRKIQIIVDRETGTIKQTVNEYKEQIEGNKNDLDNFKQTVINNYSTIEQTSTSISNSVSAMKTTIEGEVAEKYMTKASLDMYVTEEAASKKVISWINASADNIILNTKSLIFGVYPDGQYIEVTNLIDTNTNVATGVLFDGTGKVRFQPSGAFQVANTVDGKTLNYFSMYNYKPKEDGSIDGGEIQFVNYTPLNKYYNWIRMGAHINLGGDMADVYAIDIKNYDKTLTNGKFANRMYLASNTNINEFRVLNWQAGQGILGSRFTITGRNNSNSFSIYNNKVGNAFKANWIQVQAIGTDNKMIITNYHTDKDKIATYIYIDSNSSSNSFFVQNYMYNESYLGNMQVFSCSASQNYYGLTNYKLVGGESKHKANEFSFQSTSSQNRLYLGNFSITEKSDKVQNDIELVSKSGANTLYIRNREVNDSTITSNAVQLESNSTENKVLITNSKRGKIDYGNYVHLNTSGSGSAMTLYNFNDGMTNYIEMSSNWLKIRNSLSCELTLDKNQNIMLQGPNSVDINSTNYEVHLNAPKGVFVNGKKIG